MQLADLLRLAARSGATDIALGVPTGGPTPGMTASVTEALSTDLLNQYADPSGAACLRTALAGWLSRVRGRVVDPDGELTVTCGATEGVFVALLALTDPGDEVLVPEPFFELYPGMVRLAGAVPVPLPLRPPDWRIEARALAAAVTPQTRAILLNTPHNPTGRVFDDAELDLVLELCADRGLMCITDEVYEHFTFDGTRHHSPLTHPARDHAVVVSSFSKTLEICGWRVGFCVAAPPVTAALRRVHEHTTLGASHPLQLGAAAALSEPEVLVHDLGSRRDRLADQREVMVDALRRCGLRTRTPDGGWFVLAELPPGGDAASALCADLAREARVLVAPGTPFFASHEEGERWVRTTFVRDPDATRSALDRLELHLSRAAAS